MRIRQSVFLLLLCCVCVCFACQKRAPAPSVSGVPYDVKVGVVNFTQPTTTSELIAGNIPENQGKIPQDELVALDSMFHNELASTKRFYTWIPEKSLKKTVAVHDSVTPQGLEYWVAYGRQFAIDLLLVPQILNWHQRKGSKAGVTSAAHVRAEFFLIDVKNGRIIRRSIYEEQQVGLVDNILKAGDFFRRKGSWVEAQVLAHEGMLKAIQELGL